MKNTRKSHKVKGERSERGPRVLAWLSLSFSAVIFFAGEFTGTLPGGSFFAVVARLVALALLLYALFCALYKRMPRFSRVCRAIWHTCAAVMVVAFVAVEILIALGDNNDYPIYESAPTDYMIVLGAGIRGRTPSLSLISRLDEAARQLEVRPRMVAVVSGGQGPGEDITEAQAMYDYLIAKGVREEQLLKEERSVNTAQNVAYSMEVLRASGRYNGEGVIVCSNGYHLFRARILLKRAGVEPYALSAPVPYFYLTLVGYIREFFSVLFMWRTA